MQGADPNPDAARPPQTPSVPDEPARALARGVSRMLGQAGQTCLNEFTLKNGRRADVIAVSPDARFSIVEVKTTPADFRADKKWREYLPYCDFFYFAIPETFPADLLPDSCGLIVADAYGGVILRAAAEDRLNPARRRAMLLRYAQTAGRRLTQLLDPTNGL